VKDRIVPLLWHHRHHNNIKVASFTVDPHTTIRLLPLNRFTTMKLLVEVVADPILQILCILPIDTTTNLLTIRLYHPREQLGAMQLNITTTKLSSDMTMICIIIIANDPRTVDRITMTETTIKIAITVTGVRVAVTAQLVVVEERSAVAVESAAVGGNLRRALKVGGAMIVTTITINTKREDQRKQQQHREEKEAMKVVAR
jgi:hypothetical protein